METRLTRIFCQNIPGFSNENWNWQVVGKIIKDVTETRLLDSFWFSFYDCPKGSDAGDCTISKIPDTCLFPAGHYRSVKFRYKVSSENSDEFENILKDSIDENNCHISGFLEYDQIVDLAGSRFIDDDQNEIRKESRMNLVWALFCASSLLVLDCLIETAGIFTLEENQDIKENPLNSPFESMHHMFCNITGVPTRVLVSQRGIIGTDWVHIDPHSSSYRSEKIIF